jgi:hypothetical protein
MPGHPVQYLKNLSHGQNRSSTSGEPEFVARNSLTFIQPNGGKPLLPTFKFYAIFDH